MSVGYGTLCGGFFDLFLGNGGTAEVVDVVEVVELVL